MSYVFGWEMYQKLPVYSFKWKTDMSIFDKEFIRNYEDSDKGYILEVAIDYPKDLHDSHLIKHHGLNHKLI